MTRMLVTPGFLLLLQAMTSVDAARGDREFIYNCDICWGQSLGFPQPGIDAKTKLDQVAGSINPPIEPGDKIIICNDRQCVTYQFTDNRLWNGLEVRQVTATGGGNGTERPTTRPPRESGIERHWNHVCGTATGGTGSSITCIVTP